MFLDNMNDSPYLEHHSTRGLINMIDKSHPDYLKMKKEHDAIMDQLQIELDAIHARCPEWKGRDHPYSNEINAAYHKSTVAINQLIKKYPQLYSEE